MRFQHDCEKCKPIGEFGYADLYYCEEQFFGCATVIARYSNEAGDYTKVASCSPTRYRPWEKP